MSESVCGNVLPPAVRDTVCPAPVSVPEDSSEFKVLYKKSLLMYLVFT